MDIKSDANGEGQHETRTTIISTNGEGTVSNGSTPPLKGHGLRRWRRVKRDVHKEDHSPGIDASKILKRGLSISEPPRILNAADQPINQVDLADTKKSPEEPRTRSAEINLFEIEGSSAVGLQSEGSNEHSSESSVASSISKSFRQGLGHEREMERGRHLRGKVLGGVAQARAQRRKAGALQTNKKIKGVPDINSTADGESNFRGSSVIVEESESICSNGGESHELENHDGGDASGDGSNELREDHAEDGEETSRHNPQEVDNCEMNPSDEGEYHAQAPLHPHEDLFVEPLRVLQAAHQTLDKEVQMLEAINREESISPERKEDESVSAREMEELEILYVKSMEGEILCLMLSEAMKIERSAMREESALLDRQLEKVSESCRRLQKVEELLGLHNGICKTSLYWVAQLGFLFLAVAALGLQFFFPPIDRGGDVPT